MRKLVGLIENELKKQEICAVYNSELARLWPVDMSPEERKAKIKRFAKSYGLDVTFYDVGLCAIFEKADAASASRKTLPSLEIRPLKKTRKQRG